MKIELLGKNAKIDFIHSQAAYPDLSNPPGGIPLQNENSSYIKRKTRDFLHFLIFSVLKREKTCFQKKSSFFINLQNKLLYKKLKTNKNCYKKSLKNLPKDVYTKSISLSTI